jgi:hypothetical protein
MGQFGSKDRALNCIHPAVSADEFVLVFAASPVISCLAHSTREVNIGGDKRSGVAARPKAFGRIEAEASNVTNRSRPLSSHGSAVSLRGILDYSDLFSVGYRGNALDIEAIAIEVHSNYGRCPGRYGRLHPL